LTAFLAADKDYRALDMLTAFGACGLTPGGCGLQRLSRLGLGLIAAVLKNSRSECRRADCAGGYQNQGH
jgi:hypothetical protein